MPTEKTRKRIVDSFMKLLSEQSYASITYASIAEASDVGLDVLRASYDSKIDILGAFVSQIDQKVLAEADEDMEEEGARERLFDVLMTRLDFLAPHRAALRHLRDAVEASPGFGLEMQRTSAKSMEWMLAGAGIELHGLRKVGVTNALTVGFWRVLKVWLEEEDKRQPKTMAALDQMLREGQDWLRRVDKAQKRLSPFLKRMNEMRSGRRNRRQPSDEASGGSDYQI
ncbi:TetR family transcriptional regulator [Pseudovibrio sp. SPO723]|uniref:TetR family transcriptional regulator n=1 Tax=Nesiotobacter zosterae TaxID=392721 RepID=UPI0029C3A7C6|nr:TetR family transcriptional regulator [Pseudovibrio sp. SPO723]MDX5593917.1 TetR family transcriptional regulator [Pseudovibrio sp. SPO723]